MPVTYGTGLRAFSREAFGICIILREMRNGKHWRKSIREALKQQQYITSHHDIGFIIGCSYLNGMRMGQEAYDTIIVQAAKSLSTRFRSGAGVIQSWNTRTGWQAQRGWECPVIIDNMMNLEILFEATSLSGDSTFLQYGGFTCRYDFKESFSYGWELLSCS